MSEGVSANRRASCHSALSGTLTLCYKRRPDWKQGPGGGGSAPHSTSSELFSLSRPGGLCEPATLSKGPCTPGLLLMVLLHWVIDIPTVGKGCLGPAGCHPSTTGSMLTRESEKDLGIHANWEPTSYNKKPRWQSTQIPAGCLLASQAGAADLCACGCVKRRALHV